MPELPEVETTARLVRPHVLRRRIEAVQVRWARSLGGTSIPAFRAQVVGARIAQVRRRAKYVVMDLTREGAPAGALLVHLRMSGRLLVESAATQPGPYVRVGLGLEGDRALRFLDVRKFGRLTYVANPAAALARLGPEPLGPAFSPTWLRAALAKRSRMLKPLLLDQGFVAGLGNIYVDEALHRARLHPESLAHTVGPAGARRLHAAIRDILRAAIARQGSSFDGFYRTPEGRPGDYQHEFRVYGRDGEPCSRCAATILKLVVGQRGTHVCPRCQRRPRTTRR
jgi:formamidopyrimidine-DNA glycosylase